MTIETEPVGSVPRPIELILAMKAHALGEGNDRDLETLFQNALQDTIRRLEETGSPVISDGEQTKPSFVTYPLQGNTHLAAAGVKIPFADGHFRELPVLTAGPFHYGFYADSYVAAARKLTRLPVKQAVIAASAISLIYPAAGIPGYSREAFVEDLLNEAEADIRRSLDAGAYKVQIDFTEARLSLKLDPSGGLLQQFIALNNAVLDRFSAADRERIGVHSCPGGDHDSTHSADISYDLLLPALFGLHAGSFYLEYAGEKNKQQVLQTIRRSVQPGQRVFLGVTNVLDPRVETADEIRDLLLEAAENLPGVTLGSTDDCGFSPFADDTSTGREIAFTKIAARVAGTRLAEKAMSGKKHFFQ